MTCAIDPGGKGIKLSSDNSLVEIFPLFVEVILSAVKCDAC